LGSPITDVEIQKSGRYAAITSEDGKIALIDMRARKKSGFDLEASGIRFTAFSPDGTQLATGSADGVVSIWTLTALNHVIVKPKHKGEIIAIEFSPNGRFLVTGGTDGFAVMLDSKTGVELYRARHNDHVKGIAFNPDGSKFVTVSNDRTIRVWDASTGTQLLNMSQTNFVQVVKMSKDGQWIATTGDDRTVRVWSAVTGAELFQIPIQGKGTTLDFSDDGKYLTAGDDNGNIYIWDISAIPTPVESAEFYGVTTSALYSPSGNLIAASDDRRIWIINPKAIPNPTTDSQKPFSELKSNITKVIFSATDKWISLLTAGNEAVVYNIQNRGGRTIRSDYPVQAIAFTLDEKSIITGDLAGNLQVWDAFNGRLIQTPLNLGGRITSLAQASNLLAIGTEGKIHIVDINSFEEQWRLESDGANQLLAFSPDGTFLVSNNTQSQIHIWKQENGEFVFQHEMVLEGITSLAFQPGNGFLAIGATGNVYLINPSTFKEFARIPHTGTVNSVSFSLDGNILLTSSLKTLQLWDVGRIQELKQEDLVTTACGRLFENFTSEEWSTFFGDEPSRKPCPNLPTP
jgi:WD40 repeat protein